MKKLLVGLDIGTNSVGWCACDENGKIIKKNGKRLWGARLFDEASDASSRRGYRCARRRLGRRKERISLLQDLFRDEIEKIDDTFFIRLKESFYHKEDRKNQFDYTLFNDRNFSDTNYYKRFPTIYHLRDYLCFSNQKEDIRLIYLAVAHIIKFRGNFLSDKEKFESSDLSEIENSFRQLNDALDSENADNTRNKDFEFEQFCIDNSKIKELQTFAKESHTLTDTKKKLEEVLLFNGSKNKFNKEILIPLMAGSTISDLPKKFSSYFQIENDDELDVKSLCVKNEDFLDNIHILNNQGVISDNILCVFENIGKINDFLTLTKLLKDHSSNDNSIISCVFVKRYKEHQEQLRQLKKYVKDNFKEKYYKIFREIKIGQKSSDKAKLANYSHYVGSNNSNGEKSRFAHSVNKEEFYKFLKEELGLKEIKDKEEIQDAILKDIWIKMQTGEYLQRINSTENGVFPYQLHKAELDKILENQSKFYPFLNEVKDGLSTKEKICSLLTFRIPYYVGPLIGKSENYKNDNRANFSWIVRKSNEKIYPWNFENIVDKQKTQIEFIRRAAAKCTYVFNENCLAKNSLTFCLFNFYNQINKLKINNLPLTKEQKSDILQYFLTKRKISKKELKSYLQKKYDNCVMSLSGKGALGFEDGFEINFNLAPFVDFKNIMGEEFYKDKKLYELTERIIEAITIFEDKKNLEEYLKSEFENLTSEQIKSIKALDYKKWATISKNLLCNFKAEVVYEETGEVFEKSILDLLKETNQNFMEILYNEEYVFLKQIEEHNKNNYKKEFEYSGDLSKVDIKEYVDNLSFVSPLIKRPLIQAYKICEEIEKITNHRIDEYYIECARTNKNKNKKRMQKSRKTILLDLYETLGEYDKTEKEKLNNELRNIDEQRVRRDKIYLYFSQLGKDLYTGEKIEFNEIESFYDIDHIVPQSITKDDSVDNRVLVRKNVNNKKQDVYPLDKETIWQNKGGWSAALKFWDYLRKQKLISDTKFINLTRRELTNEDLDGFVNRQLTTTNQAVKCFTKAIKELKSTDDFSPEIIYSKAENVSDYRKLTSFAGFDNENKPIYKGYLGLDKSGDENNKIYEADILKNRTVNNFHHAHDAYLNIIVGRTLDTYFNNLRLKYGNDFHKNAHNDGWTTNVNRVFVQNDIKKKNDIFDRDGSLVYSYDNTLREVQHNIRECFDIFVTERCFVKNELFGKISINSRNGGNNSIPIKETEALKKTDRYGGMSGYGFSHYVLYEKETKKNKEYILEAIPRRFKGCEEQYLRDVLKIDDFKILLPAIKVNALFEQKINLSSDKEIVNKYVVTGKTGNLYLIKNRSERIFPYDIIKIVKRIEKVNTSRANSDNVGLTEDEVQRVYDYFVNLLEKPVYSSFTQSASILGILKDNKGIFNSLPLIDKSIEKGKELKKDKCMFIMNLLDFLKCNERKTVDLGLINGDKNTGTLRINKKLKNCNIVFESITGFYRKKVFSC